MEFCIGVVVGDISAFEETLKTYNVRESQSPVWDESPIVDYIVSTDRLHDVGLSSIPTWFRPFHLLSTGEQYRAILARCLASGTGWREFGSVLDTATLHGVARGLMRIIRNCGYHNIVVHTSRMEILRVIKPCWTIGNVTPGIPIPSSEVALKRVNHRVWSRFFPHHYLSGDLNQRGRAYILTDGNKEVGFVSVLPHIAGAGAWRIHRLVVLPAYQGLGVGSMALDLIGEYYTHYRGSALYIKTTHPKAVRHCKNSIKWSATADSERKRTGRRTGWSYKFIGDRTRSFDESVDKAQLRFRIPREVVPLESEEIGTVAPPPSHIVETYGMNEHHCIRRWRLPDIQECQLIVIEGSSGSGKTSLLRQNSGLYVLWKADMDMSTLSDGACIDEFASGTMRSAEEECRLFMDHLNKTCLSNIVVASCHDIRNFLKPDYVIDADRGWLFHGKDSPRFPCGDAIVTFSV